MESLIMRKSCLGIFGGTIMYQINSFETQRDLNTVLKTALTNLRKLFKGLIQIKVERVFTNQK